MKTSSMRVCVTMNEKSDDTDRRERIRRAKEKYRRLVGNQSAESSGGSSTRDERPPHWGDQLFSREKQKRTNKR